MKYLTQLEATNIDKYLLSIYKLEQLIELAGLSIAQSIKYLYPNKKNIMIYCGPGNNGADGLVAARHLSLWSYNVKVWIPSSLLSSPTEANEMQKKGELEGLKENSKKINEKLLISTGVELSNDLNSPADLIVDALLGFGSKGQDIREPIKGALDVIIKRSRNVSTVSIDIPTGWQVDEIENTIWMPETLLSMMAPKKCALGFNGLHHMIAGRFLPISLAKELELPIEGYKNDFQYFIKLF